MNLPTLGNASKRLFWLKTKSWRWQRYDCVHLRLVFYFMVLASAELYSFMFLFLQEEKEKVTQVTEVLENELQCIICSELFVEVRWIDWINLVFVWLFFLDVVFYFVLLPSTGSHPELRSQLLLSLHPAVAQEEGRVSHVPTGHPVPDPLPGAGQLHRQHGGEPEPGHEGQTPDAHHREERWEVRYHWLAQFTKHFTFLKSSKHSKHLKSQFTAFWRFISQFLQKYVTNKPHEISLKHREQVE